MRPDKTFKKGEYLKQKVHLFEGVQYLVENLNIF